MKSCLIVDDSKVVRMVARKILAELGFTVGEAADGQAAIEACGAAMPDLVLLDWNMPIMSGIEFVKHLRGMKGGDAPSVIFCTTEKDFNHIREAIGAGANEYIMKPFDSEIVETKLAQLGLL